MEKTCIICGSDDASVEHLLETPCRRHWVCIDDVSSFFERATETESLYPPKCCDQIFSLDLYEGYIPFDVQWAYRMKEQGEYSVLAKYRVYCANPICSKFLSPSTYLKDPSTDISYAVCQNEACGKLTCTSCKTAIDGVEGHSCGESEDYKKFRQTATEKGFQECPNCATTVELAEACNHMTCECGTQFCYVCGRQWQGMHGCPEYGPALYDEEDYNQQGYHRTTGLNREGRTHREQDRIDREEDGEFDEDEEDDDEDHNANHLVLQHVGPAIRSAFATLPHEDREMFLINLQIQLFEERGITFGNPEEDGGESDGNGEEDGESDNGSDNSLDDGDHDEGLEQVDEDEEGDDAEKDDEIGQGGDDNERTEADAEGDAGTESLDVAMTEAMHDLKDSSEDRSVARAGDAQMATMMQSNAELTDPDDVKLAQVAQHPEVITEREAAVHQYLMHLTKAYAGVTNNDADEVDRTVIFRPMRPDELADTLLRMRADATQNTVSRDITRRALEVLLAMYPAEERASRFRTALFHRNGRQQGEHGESSARASSDEDQPTTPMDVDPADGQGQEEREGWKGPLGGWPVDEEL